MGGTCSTIKGEGNACRSLVGKPEGKRPLGRPYVCGWIILGWVVERDDSLAQDRDQWRALVNAVMNILVPCNAGKFLSGLTTGGILSSSQLHRVS
jgi:hypothetical protein